MNRNPFFPLLAFLLFAGSCSYKVNRIGYTPAESSEIEEITLAYQQDMARRTPIGTVVIDDDTFTTNCRESDALKVLRKEAGIAGANFVNITSDWRPDFSTTCYRCTAELYSLSADETPPSSNYYEPEQIAIREKMDRKTNARNNISGTLIGAGFGLALISYIFIITP